MASSRTAAVTALFCVSLASALSLGCASAPKPAPMTPLEAALAAPPPSEASHANDPAYNPPGENDFTISERTPESTAPRAATPGTSVRADGAAKTAKQKIHPAAP